MPLADYLTRIEETKRILADLSKGDAIYTGGRRYVFVSYTPENTFPLVMLSKTGQYEHLIHVRPEFLARDVFRVVPLAKQRAFAPRKARPLPYVQNDAGSPAEERADCAVRALAIAVDVEYAIAHAFMKQHGRRDGQPTFAAGMPYRQWCGNDYRITALDDLTLPERTIGAWIKSGELPARAIVGIKGHVFAVIGGVIHDQFGIGPRSKVNRVYRVDKITR